MGRPIGAKDRKPRNSAAKKQAAECEAAGITPLDVLLTTMRDVWAEAERHRGIAADMDRPDLRDSELHKATMLRMSACTLAEKAAPYVHSKLAATTITADVDVTGTLAVQIYLPDNGRGSDATETADRAAGDVPIQSG